MQTPRAVILVLLAMFAGSMPVGACGDDVDGGSASSSQGGTTSGTSGSTTGGATGSSSTDASGTDGATTSGTAATDTTGTPPTTGGTTSTGTTSPGTTSTTGTPPNDCCVPHRAPGCADSHIQACVCGADLTCCVPDHGWDEICVKEVTTFGCGVCEMALADERGSASARE